MSHPFDATLKEVVEAHAADFVPAFGLPTGLPAITLNVDLSTLSAATDVALGFGDPLVEIADLNFQSGPDSYLESRLLVYAAALHHRFHVPVRTVLVLLRPGADHSRLSGAYAFAGGSGRVEFSYQVVRLWRMPAGPFLTGGLGLLPLATLCEMPPGVALEAALAGVVRDIERRLLAETSRAAAVRLMTAAFILTGTRVERETLGDLYRGVRLMHESSAFDYFVEEGRTRGIVEGRVEGRVEEAQRLLLRQGQNRLGRPTATAEAAMRSVVDVDRLERMADAVLTATTWDELLATP